MGDDIKGLVAAMLEAVSDGDKPTGREIYAELFETASESAVPLPRDLFNGPRDKRWVRTADGTALTPYLPG